MRIEFTTGGVRVFNDSGKQIHFVPLQEHELLGHGTEAIQKYLERRADRMLRTGCKSGRVFRGESDEICPTE